jgi:hypothetical protein
VERWNANPGSCINTVLRAFADALVPVAMIASWVVVALEWALPLAVLPFVAVRVNPEWAVNCLEGLFPGVVSALVHALRVVPDVVHLPLVDVLWCKIVDFLAVVLAGVMVPLVGVFVAFVLLVNFTFFTALVVTLAMIPLAIPAWLVTIRKLTFVEALI